MKQVRLWMAVCAAGVLSVSVGQAQPPMPKPGPEHEQLKKLEGAWEASVSFAGGSSKGTMTYKMGIGGLWLRSSFKGDFGGMPFEGTGLDTYDPAKKKYIGVWVDSMVTTPLIMEGTYDKDAKTLTMIGEGPGMDGKPAKLKTVTEMKDDDNMVFTMSAPDKDGAYQTMMTITYIRKKK
jgi:hypothetical protein